MYDRQILIVFAYVLYIILESTVEHSFGNKTLPITFNSNVYSKSHRACIRSISNGGTRQSLYNNNIMICSLEQTRNRRTPSNYMYTSEWSQIDILSYWTNVVQFVSPLNLNRAESTSIPPARPPPPSPHLRTTYYTCSRAPSLSLFKSSDGVAVCWYVTRILLSPSTWWHGIITLTDSVCPCLGIIAACI